MISEAAHAECVRLLELLTNKRVQESWSWVFMTPVDIPGYRDVIKKPMDLGTVKKNLGSKPSRCRFKSHEKFARDVRLVFNNALLYNKDDHNVKGSVYDAAQHLLRVFETAYTKSIETVLRADDAATERKKQQEKEGVRGESSKEASGGSARPAAGMAATAVAAAPSAGVDSHHHSDHHHRHRHHGEGDESSKHKKDKSSKKDKSKKEKKSKKSKKKSKERDDEKDREHKHRHHSSSESKKKLVRRDSDASTASSEGGVTSAVTDKVAAPSRIEATSSREDVRVYHEVPRQPTPKSSSVAPAAVVSAGEKMSEEELTACQAVLMKLIKYKEGNVSPAAPFLQPVDLTHFPDYRVKVPNRMHLYGVQRKLRSGSYPNKDAFAYDVRLIFANCLVYNSDVVLTKVMRSHAVTLMKLFEAQFAKIGGTWPGIPERWKCHYIIDELLAHRTDGQETAQWFKYPIETYYNSPDQIPYGYYKKVKVPMDLGTVSSRLHLGEYKRASEFIDGLQLVFDNCIKYWKSDPYGQTYCDSAEALIKLLHAQAARLLNGSSSGAADAEDKRVSSSSSRAQSGPASVVSKSSSSSGDREKTKKKSSKSSSSRDSASGSAFPHKDICMSILKLLRAHKMKGYRGIEIPTAGPFLHAVDTTKYPDYLTIISEPMDFAKIERKLKSDRYVSVSEFSADVHLIFSNCHKYNSDPVEGADIRAMASNLRDYFVMLYNEKLGHLDGTFEQRPVPVKSESSLSSLAVKPSSGLAEPSKERAASSITKIDTAAPSAAKISTSSDRLSTPSVLPARDRDSEKPVAVKPSRVVETPVKREAAVSNPIPSSTAKIESKVGVPAHGTTVSTATSLHTQVHSNTDELSVKKEKKEKKEKKKKDKKEKKEKKKKKEKRHDKHEKKHDKHEKKRDKTSSVEAGATTSAISLQPSSTLQTPSALASAGSAAAPSNATPRSVGSKVSSADASNAAASSSKKSSKKSKKTDLKSWEATCERILNRLAKIEQVSKLHFDKPLVEVFPQLTAEYTRLIPDPMDLRTLREQLHRHELTQDEFVRKGRVIFENAVKFNCAEDPASMHVREMSTHLLWYFDSLCVEHHLSPLSAKGLNRAQLRQERAELVTNIPMEIKAKECQKLLRVLNSQKYDKNCWPFRKPVRVLFPTLPPEYFDVIKTPMDLTTIGEKLATFEYKTHGDFIADVRLTFENAMVYNHADKDREGWNVYAAAVHMLAVVEDLLGDMTLEVNERIRRRELTRKERERLGEKKVKSDHHHSSSQKEDTPKKAPKTSKVSDTVIKLPKPSGDVSSRPPLPPASSTSATAGSDAGVNDPSATRIKLSLVNRPNLERMNKSERKAEEKRRKRARREEEIARSEKRRRTAVAATDDALREAEARSRRRLQKLEMAQAMRAREDRERQVKEEAEARALAEKRKFDASTWSGVLAPAQAASTGFWARKRVKLQVPTVFQTMINA